MKASEFKSKCRNAKEWSDEWLWWKSGFQKPKALFFGKAFFRLPIAKPDKEGPHLFVSFSRYQPIGFYDPAGNAWGPVMVGKKLMRQMMIR